MAAPGNSMPRRVSMNKANVVVNSIGPNMPVMPRKLVSALQLALIRRSDIARHQALGRRSEESPQRHERQAEQEEGAGRGQTKDCESDRAERQAGEHPSPLTEAAHKGLHQSRLDDHRAHAHHGQRQAHGPFFPAIAIAGVEHKCAG